MSMKTIGGQLEDNNGVGPGFDAVRLGLATAVLFIHASLIAPGVTGAEGDLLFPHAPVERWALNFAVVPMFFALSGFLVAASAERLSVVQFLVSRLLRIVPALAVEITLSALVLGPLVTTVALGAYYTDPRFARYFLNILGSVHYELPGVFETNPAPGVVNGSLWTVPHELGCYAMVAALVMLGVFRRNWLLPVATAGLFGAAIVVFLCGALGHPLPMQAQLDHLFVTRGAARLIPVFLTGMLFYRYRHRIPYRVEYAAIAVVGYVAIASFGSPGWNTNPLFNAAVAPLFAYSVVYAGLSPALKLDVLKGGDYSYGVYLYGFPIQQALIATMPGVHDVGLFYLMSLVCAFAMATFSWRYVEKPILRMRRRFSVAGGVHAATAAEPQARIGSPETRRAAFG